MYDMITNSWSTIPQDPARDMALAKGAARYLERQGLDHAAVVRLLIGEFDLDRETAIALVSTAARRPQTSGPATPPTTRIESVEPWAPDHRGGGPEPRRGASADTTS